MLLVFQYGSNLSTARLNGPDRLQGAAEVVGLARTVDPFRISFDADTGAGWAAANLLREGDEPAVGVLYRIPEERVVRGVSPGVRTLDDIEHESQIYARQEIGVHCEAHGEDSIEVWTYLVIEPRRGVPTRWEYVRHILIGLVEHGAPLAYRRRVEQRILEHQPDLSAPLREWSESIEGRRKG